MESRCQGICFWGEPKPAIASLVVFIGHLHKNEAGSERVQFIQVLAELPVKILTAVAVYSRVATQRLGPGSY